jgi:hypothetical protein
MLKVIPVTVQLILAVHFFFVSSFQPWCFMKISIRSSALLACAVFGFSLGASPAHATTFEMVRMSQIRLADLGYYAGQNDGAMGPAMQSAIKGFQAHNGLPISGQLTAQTYDLLLAQDYKRQSGVAHASVTPSNRWHHVGTERVPVRYGALNVNEDVKGSIHRYTVTLNGHPFLRADDQPGALRISKTFEMNGEDAVIMTAFSGEDGCAYKNYLVTIHNNGAAASSREIASCAPSSEMRMANNALFVRFPSTMNKDGWASWDVWRYENQMLVRL